MKCDMAGAAAVVQATFAIAELGLPVKVTTFAPMAENMVSGSAMRPGDVLTHVRRHDRRGAQHRRRGPAGPRRRAGPRHRAEARRDPRRGHADRAHGGRARRPGRPACSAPTTSSARSWPPARPAGEEQWPMPIPEEMDERVHSSKIADLRPARLDPLGRRAVRRGVPARVHRRPALGPPRHRRARRSTPAAAYGPRHLRAAPASPSPRWWTTPRALT